MSKFYGQKEIKDIKDCTDSNLQEVIFSDQSSITLPKVMIAATESETPTDPTTLRNKRCFPVAKEVLEVLLKWDVNINEIDFITQRVIMSINESLKKADEVLWKKPREEQTMSDVNNIMMSVPSKGEISSPFM